MGKCSGLCEKLGILVHFIKLVYERRPIANITSYVKNEFCRTIRKRLLHSARYICNWPCFIDHFYEVNQNSKSFPIDHHIFPLYLFGIFKAKHLSLFVVPLSHWYSFAQEYTLALKHKSPIRTSEMVQEGNYYKLIYSMMINHVEYFFWQE